MKFRLFQTLLITAMIVTWGGTLQAISIINNTKYTLLVKKNVGEWINVKPNATENWPHTEAINITLYASAVFSGPGGGMFAPNPPASCIVSPSGQLTVSYAKSPNYIAVSCTS